MDYQNQGKYSILYIKNNQGKQIVPCSLSQSVSFRTKMFQQQNKMCCTFGKVVVATSEKILMQHQIYCY